MLVLQVVDAVQAAESALGHVDVLICCAGAAELGEPQHLAHLMQCNSSRSSHARLIAPAAAADCTCLGQLRSLCLPGLLTAVAYNYLNKQVSALAGYFHECDVSLFERQMQLNYMGSVHAAKAVYSGMIARNSGHICFVASTLSLLGET